MGKQVKVKLLTSIASSEGWAFQCDQIAQVDSALAAKWVSGGIAESVSASTPLTSFDELDGLKDLSQEQALRHRCTFCDKRAARVLGSRPFCIRAFSQRIGIGGLMKLKRIYNADGTTEEVQILEDGEERSLDFSDEIFPPTMDERRRMLNAFEVKDRNEKSENFRRYLEFGPDGIDETRAQTTVTSGGGYTVDEQFSRTFDTTAKQYDQLFDVSTRVVTARGGPFQYPVDNDTGQAAAIVTENSGSATNVDVVFDNVAFPKCPNWRSGMIRCPVELVQDSAFPLVTVLAGIFARRFARGVGASFVTALLAAADAAVTSASSSALTGDEVLGLVGAVDPAFMNTGTFAMNPATLLYLQKLKASTGGSYLIESSTDAAGYPTIFGRRVYCSPSYPTVAGDAKVISFGDHTKFISREVRSSLAVKTYIERFAEYGQVAYEGHWQIQGDLAKSGAGPLPVRLLQCHS